MLWHVLCIAVCEKAHKNIQQSVTMSDYDNDHWSVIEVISRNAHANLIVAQAFESIFRVKILTPTVGTIFESFSNEGSHRAERSKLFPENWMWSILLVLSLIVSQDHQVLKPKRPADTDPTQMTIESEIVHIKDLHDRYEQQGISQEVN